MWDTEADATAFYETMKVRFPALAGDAAAKATRVLVQRGATVEFVEAPIDALAPALELIKKAERK